MQENCMSVSENLSDITVLRQGFEIDEYRGSVGGGVQRYTYVEF